MYYFLAGQRFKFFSSTGWFGQGLMISMPFSGLVVWFIRFSVFNIAKGLCKGFCVFAFRRLGYQISKDLRGSEEYFSVLEYPGVRDFSI